MHRGKEGSMSVLDQPEFENENNAKSGENLTILHKMMTPDAHNKKRPYK